MGGGTFYIGEIKNFAFFKLENFQNLLKINETFILFKILSKFWDFLNLLIFSINFRENLGKIFENMGL